MYLTSTVRLPMFTIGQEPLNFWGLEPVLIGENVFKMLSQHPMFRYLIPEEIPKVHKKRYFKGCLEGLKTPKLLIQRYGGIGDIMWVLPAIRELKKRFPESIIRFACFEKDIELIYNCDFIDEHVTTQFPMPSDIQWADYVIDFFDTVEGIGTDEAKQRNPIDINEEIIGYKIQDKSTFYKIEDFEVKQAKTLLTVNGLKEGNKVIGFPLVASSPHRTWGLQFKVIDMLLRYDENLKIVVTGKDGMLEPIVARIKQLNNKRIINLIGQTTVRQLFSVLNECDVIFSNDTGAVHVMAGLNKKIVAVYSTVPKKTRISHYPTVTGLEVKAECAPCYKLTEQCQFGEKCLSSIKAEDVFNEIVKKMEDK